MHFKVVEIAESKQPKPPERHMITRSMIKEIVESVAKKMLPDGAHDVEIEFFVRAFYSMFGIAATNWAIDHCSICVEFHSRTGEINFDEMMRSAILMHLWHSCGLSVDVCSRTLDEIDRQIAISFQNDSIVEIESVGLYERKSSGYVLHLRDEFAVTRIKSS